MAPRRTKINKFDYNNLSANDVICPICRRILTKPISLPCSHAFCSSCFEITTHDASSVVCPLCRVRVGSWLRSATKLNKVINEVFWEAIQKQFPVQVKKKLNDEHTVTDKRENKKSELGLKTLNMRANKEIEFKTEKCNQSSSCQSKSSKNDKTLSLLNNFATKQYTCRILCQNSKPSRKIFKESQNSNMTSKQLMKDRSNSIESECIYFKPIDHRNNPPSEGLTPIKVPTKKPSIKPNVKILAPSGQNQINIHYLESAFARLSVPKEEKIVQSKKENIDFQVEEEESLVVSPKRKLKSDCKTRKKIKNCHKTSQIEVKKVNEQETEKDIADDAKTIKAAMATLIQQERLRQIKADFELATKLQQTYDQASKYSTRSSALKRIPTKNQMNIKGIMTPYKVK